MTKKRKKYVRPAVKSEKIIETAALSCGKCTIGLPFWDPNCGIIIQRS
ncbi:MAG: hypothetical protein JXJ19_04965 [Elusimicrobia bacterium]|nr:hypothetical protein [Elusimicrobiota bacterium]